MRQVRGAADARVAIMARAGVVACSVLGITLAAVAPPPLPAAAARGAASRFPYAVSGVVQVAQLIGSTPTGPHAADDPQPQSINDTTRWGICDGDLGSLMYWRGTAYITLGDNFTTCPLVTGGPPMVGAPDWRSNAMGVITNPADFTHGLHIARWISRDGRHAVEVVPSAHDAGDCQNTVTPGCEVTRIPTAGFATQDHLFLAFMSVHHWGQPGLWDVNYASLAMSSTGGRTWTVETPAIRWGLSSNFAQVAVTHDPAGSHLLFFGIPGGRFGAVKLMRAPNTWRGVLDQHAYQYFVGADARGQPRWSSSAAHAAVVAGAPVGELSVIYDVGLRHWLMTYLQGGGDLVIRSAPHSWGPWSEPATLASQVFYPSLYGAFMDSHFLANAGHTVYFVMSQFSPYRIFWMKVTLTGGGG